MGRKAERDQAHVGSHVILRTKESRCRILGTAVGMETPDLCSSPGGRWVFLTREQGVERDEQSYAYLGTRCKG